MVKKFAQNFTFFIFIACCLLKVGLILLQCRSQRRLFCYGSRRFDVILFVFFKNGIQRMWRELFLCIKSERVYPHPFFSWRSRKQTSQVEASGTSRNLLLLFVCFTSNPFLSTLRNICKISFHKRGVNFQISLPPYFWNFLFIIFLVYYYPR